MENVIVKVKYSRGINPIEKIGIGDWIDLNSFFFSLIIFKMLYTIIYVI